MFSSHSLIAFYRNAHETRQASELLGALGNSVGPAVIPVIEKALHDSRVPIRSAAARALRLAPGSEIDQILAAVIACDQDPAVRADAIFAVRFRRLLRGHSDAHRRHGHGRLRPQRCCGSA